MRRIYIESFVSLIVLFFSGLVSYNFIVYELDTDYDYVLEDYQAEALHTLLTQIAHLDGQQAANEALYDYAKHIHKTLSQRPFAELPQEVQDHFSDPNQHSPIFHDDDRNLWLRLEANDNIYFLQPDGESLVYQAIDRADNLLLVFMLGSFALYCMLLIWFLSRRLRELEKVTHDFANGNLQARASTKSSKSVGKLNHSFNLMADKISHLILSNKALTNAIAHDLRTPIFRIQWQAEVLAESPLSDKQHQQIASIIEDTEEMETMVDELLYYAKLEHPESEIQSQRLDGNEWLAHFVNEQTHKSSLQIQYTPSSKSLMLDVDPQLLTRALTNLIRNAEIYAGDRLMIETNVTDNQFCIAVHDNGPGIDEQHWPHIFDAFYSTDSSRNKAQSGFGLGLAIVKQIMIRHYGEVTLSKSPLGGACFSLWLPLAQNAD
ncbi:HAMP domain-containing protein [Vibrio mimicus]|uniref:histidine kinase CarS n=1 Tax=Vibrio mimicus TaxID=674 RepID=UPI0011D7540D|nr:histidine kinase CarS [Vibrio mimicus]TXY23725.1 HAMP domain-containing protein [Vibrio mimicus]TXY44898.1 HAMP domain-containing protein [Vibrio mimicus]